MVCLSENVTFCLMSRNEVLWNRVLRLEEERSTSQTAWQSAEDAQDNVDQIGFGLGDLGSNPSGEGCAKDDHKGALDSMRYEQGYQRRRS